MIAASHFYGLSIAEEEHIICDTACLPNVMRNHDDGVVLFEGFDEGL